MSQDMVSLIDQLGAASLECKELLADVRTATKDLRAAVKEANDTREQLAVAVREMITADINAGVAERMEELTKATKEATASAVAAIYERFDKITNVLLSGDHRTGRSDGGLDLRKLGGAT